VLSVRVTGIDDRASAPISKKSKFFELIFLGAVLK